MNLKIFRDAFNVYQGGYVEVTGISDRVVSFVIKDVDVRVEKTLSGIKFYCGCEAHMHRMVQDKLCKRVIAALVYISRQKRLVQSAFVEIARKMSTPGKVWLESAEDKKAIFDVQGKEVWIERIPTGTRVRTMKDSKIIQDKFTLEMLAVILYVYERKGKLKK